MRYTNRFIAFLTIALLFLQMQLVFSFPVSAQGLGLIPITKEELARVPLWKPDSEGIGELPRIDLRQWLPPVLLQFGNSCTGCSIAYGCKSYLEARDRSWSPAQKAHQFSPAFIYNQLNGGVDRGSHLIEALNLAVRNGCATLVTMPYDHNFLRQPTTRAFDEAKRYRSHSYSRLDTGLQIRKALQQGYAVVLAINTNPEFNSGLHWNGVYTAAQRQSGDQRRSSSDPHGYHAILAVGYDDTRQAFLLMNSWGREWGQQGFCWVAYDLMRNVAPLAANFCDAAFVLMNPPRPQPGPPAQVSATGSVRYSGYLNGIHNWLWTAKLSVTPAVGGTISRVEWTTPYTMEGTNKFTSTKGDDGFAIHGQAQGKGQLSVSGKVIFKDGSARNVVASITFAPPVAAKRSLQMVQEDRYSGRVSGQPYWEWTISLRGTVTDLADVSKVTYHLHPTFPNPDRVVTSSPLNGFAFTTTGWGVFPVRATVHFKDGSTSEHSLQLKFRSAIRDNLELFNTALPTVSRAGQQYYDWTAYIAGPLQKLHQIRFVRYHLHPTFHPNVYDITQNAEYGFPFSTSGWGEFTVGATVVFQNGSQTQLTHRLDFKTTKRVN